jgi:hypothetical protein
MSSIAVGLPLAIDDINGFRMIKSIKGLAKQNLKMLLLTNPGERVMDPEFGVGISKYLFQHFTTSTYADIDAKIREQVSIYMPGIKITRIAFDSSEQDRAKLGFSIEYSLPNIGLRDLLEFTI